MDVQFDKRVVIFRIVPLDGRWNVYIYLLSYTLLFQVHSYESYLKNEHKIF